MNNAIPLLNNRVNMRKDGQEWIIMTPSGKMLSANDTAILVLKQCNGSRSVDEVVTGIAGMFKVKADKKLADAVVAFLNDMAKARCIELVNDKFVAPSATLIGPSGPVEIKLVDARVFDKKMSADPPCQL
jgi:hypothetical protein